MEGGCHKTGETIGANRSPRSAKNRANRLPDGGFDVAKAQSKRENERNEHPFRENMIVNVTFDCSCGSFIDENLVMDL